MRTKGGSLGMISWRFLILLLALAAGGCATRADDGLARIEHIVVIYAENRSFDHLYGLFPGAEGIANATAEQKTQLDHDGTPLPHLPPVYENGKPDSHNPAVAGLPNGPFRIDLPPVSRRMDEVLPSPIHALHHHREQINGGRNHRFVAMSSAGAWDMRHFDGSSMKRWQWAQEYTLAGHFFAGAFGGSFLNHLWLACACTPAIANAPDGVKAKLDEKSHPLKKPGAPPSVLLGPGQVYEGAPSPYSP